MMNRDFCKCRLFIGKWKYSDVLCLCHRLDDDISTDKPTGIEVIFQTTTVNVEKAGTM